MHPASTTTPEHQDYAPQHEFLDRCVRGTDRARSGEALRRYFGHDGNQPYTGSWFERFAGGGDRANDANVVTEADVLALNFLSITDLAHVAIDVTTGYPDQIRDLLEQIPVNVPMHEALWTHYSPGSPADQLWEIFKHCGGKNRWVTANKLLARKRPHLLPVYDNQVKALLGAPTSFWACLWTWFDSDSTRAEALSNLRANAGGIDDISLLRCLDVILWMRATSEPGTEATEAGPSA